MAFKVFLDANVILDFTLKRKNHEASKSVMELVVTGEINGFINPSIVHIVGYWLCKSYSNKKAKELLIALLGEVSVIDLPHEVAVNALHSKIDDIEDALQYYTAIHHKMDYFISSDKKLQRQSIPVLPVCTPGELLDEILG